MEALTYHGFKDPQANGRLQSEATVTHPMKLEEAPEAYKLFDEKWEDCRKIVLRP